MKPEDVITIYEKHGTAWARDRARSLFEKPWLDRMLHAAPRAKGAVSVLDLGCGAGEPIATYLADRGAQITGVDASEPLTALFTQNLPDATVVRADMRQLALDRAFDAILAWDSFFHLSANDQRAMFAVFKAHAAPRAALMFTSGHVAGEAIGQVAGAPIYHASLSADEYRDLLHNHGFRVLHHMAEDPDCGGHTIWLAQYQSA
ncbi:class I SAM-dependent methyltransferase [Cognatiyoonia sp. IB215446]|uniref:class I SAM-dependent methyltransferase n=1 Tax=Cognatiyoonia sp. IB215446 TaxID=3097355 RepID=UPI002A15E544|nr:class I SAM-dependent methyltransferase [Cognatiyoonia sp. IB215446]MDX8348575.1 class I SAM-dependent methyltransferase [Cognatiyoonia sp. IB215446]